MDTLHVALQRMQIVNHPCIKCVRARVQPPRRGRLCYECRRYMCTICRIVENYKRYAPSTLEDVSDLPFNADQCPCIGH